MRAAKPTAQPPAAAGPPPGRWCCRGWAFRATAWGACRGAAVRRRWGPKRTVLPRPWTASWRCRSERVDQSLTARWFAACGPGVEADLLADEDESSPASITTALPPGWRDACWPTATGPTIWGRMEPGDGQRSNWPSTTPQPTADLSDDPRRSSGGKRPAGTSTAQETLPYDPSSVELPYILQAMMFSESADGRRYTGLVNRYQPFIDLTGTLLRGRARAGRVCRAVGRHASRHRALRQAGRAGPARRHANNRLPLRVAGEAGGG